MQFVSEGSGAKTVHAAREESSNPEPPRFAEDGMSLYERLKDNKEKKSVQIDSERVTAGGPSAISEEEYMFFIELERKQKHISKQVDRETEAFQKQVQTLTYQPDTSLLTIVAQKSKSGAKKDAKKPKLNVRPKTDVTAGDKRKERDEEHTALPAAKRSKHDAATSADDAPSAAAAPNEDTESSGLGALLGYGSDADE
jgi:hypothetical protein